MHNRLHQYFQLMNARYGQTGWWPADSPFEIAVGAILTQNTSWTNVESALNNLKTHQLLHPERILNGPLDRLENALRPSGFFRVKAKRLRHFCRYLIDTHHSNMESLASLPLPKLRRQLLDIHGIGPETADDIILYACHKPVFVIDAYTRRIFGRHGLLDKHVPYEDGRAFFENHLERDVALFKEFHALIVLTGKDYCKSAPQCENCPLAPLLKKGQPLLD